MSLASFIPNSYLANWVMHAAAALALLGIVRRTLAGSAVAFAVAGLWLVHPLQTESLAQVTPRTESLAGLCYLLTLFCFVQAGDGRRGLGWLAASVVSCAVGMTTSTVMVTAPLMVLLFDRCFVAGTFLTAWRRRSIFYLALAGTWWVRASTFGSVDPHRDDRLGFSVAVSGWDYALTQFKAVGHTLWLSAWPHPLVFDYGVFWVDAFGDIALELALVLALLAVTIIALWRRSPLGFVGAWFFGTLGSASLESDRSRMIVEHRMYLPLAAFITLLVIGLNIWVGRRRPRIFASLVGALALAFVLLVVRRQDDYRSELALWADTAAKRPNNPLAHFKLGGAEERAGKTAAAIASYTQTLELKPDFARGHETLGEILLREGRRSEAIAHFESALRLQPQYAEAHAHLGNAYLADVRIAEAIGHLEKAAQLGPTSASLQTDLGNALSAAGLADEAKAHFEAAERLRNAFPK